MIMQEIIEKLKSIWDGWFVFFVIIISIFIIYADGFRLRRRKQKKEAMMATILGWVYIIGVLGVYVIFFFIK